MSDLLKKLKVKDGTQDKFLTIDENGNIVSASIGNTDINNISSRVSALEGVTAQLTDKVIDINGEEV